MRERGPLARIHERARGRPRSLEESVMESFLEIFDIYLLEAVLNGILLGGPPALLALGLNLICGVIDVTWICYAELVMIGMYGMYFLVQYYGLSSDRKSTRMNS